DSNAAKVPKQPIPHATEVGAKCHEVFTSTFRTCHVPWIGHRLVPAELLTPLSFSRTSASLAPREIPPDGGNGAFWPAAFWRGYRTKARWSSVAGLQVPASHAGRGDAGGAAPSAVTGRQRVGRGRSSAVGGRDRLPTWNAETPSPLPVSLAR